MEGRVVNVSGADDLDKQGQRYADYFVNASTYSITNHSTSLRGFQARDGEIALDLSQPLPDELVKAFDAVFNHTTLEHIFEVDVAFRNLCEMATSYVILVVPFAQVEHGPPAFGDYWRFTPMGVEALFTRAGWHIASLAASPMKNAACYLFAVGAATEELAGRLPAPSGRPYPLGDWIGAPSRNPARALCARVRRLVSRAPRGR